MWDLKLPNQGLNSQTLNWRMSQPPDYQGSPRNYKLKTAEIYCLTALGKTKSRCPQGHTSSEGSRGKPSLLLSVPGNSRHFLACGWTNLLLSSQTFFPAPLCPNLLLLSLIKKPVIRSGVYPKFGMTSSQIL